MYKGLLIRLVRPSEDEIARHAGDAADGYENWRLALPSSDTLVTGRAYQPDAARAPSG